MMNLMVKKEELMSSFFSSSYPSCPPHGNHWEEDKLVISSAQKGLEIFLVIAVLESHHYWRQESHIPHFSLLPLVDACFPLCLFVESSLHAYWLALYAPLGAVKRMVQRGSHQVVIPLHPPLAWQQEALAWPLEVLFEPPRACLDCLWLLRALQLRIIFPLQCIPIGVIC